MKFKPKFLTHLFIAFGVCLSLAAGANAQTTEDFWGLKLGHSWSYAGSFEALPPNTSHTYSVTEQITEIDVTTFPVSTFKLTETDPLDPSFDWYSTTPTELILWGAHTGIDSVTTEAFTVVFDTGILWARNPMFVGDSWSDSTTGTVTDSGGPPQGVTMTVNSVVESQEIVTVPQGTHNAYKIRHEFLIEAVGNLPETATNITWFVPYLGEVKVQDIDDSGTYTEHLMSTTVTLPVDMTFLDVPPDNLAKTFIEDLSAAGITGGCAAGALPQFCPDNPVTRGQMAVFLVGSLNGVPNACTGLFADVPPEHPFCGFIEKLTADGITGGCGNGNFCPDSPVTRGQMASLSKQLLETPPMLAWVSLTTFLSKTLFAGLSKDLLSTE
jgi:hypothetical protein